MEHSIENHYRHDALLEALRTAYAGIGKSVEELTVADLGPIDEFHIGGRPATQRLVEQLAPVPDAELLDIGCGMGGAARYVAETYGARVTGIDLTEEFVAAGTEVNRWVGLEAQISLRHGSALEMPFEDGQFWGAYMIHVGMNIAAKAQLFREVHRVLKPGRLFAIYDVMKIGDGTVAYPVPWASAAALSHLGTLEMYETGLRQAGFQIEKIENRRKFALEVFAKQRERQQANGGPGAIGLHIIVGKGAASKFRNMIQAIQAGVIAPIEIIVRK